MIENISIVIITRDAMRTLSQTLDSVRDFAEVVVYDNGSTDSTLEIASGFPNVKLERGAFFGFGPTKNHAVDLASNDWVFSLDSDETVSPNLADELSKLDLSHEDRAYELLRKNYFMGKHICRGGWGNDWIVRIFNRKFHSFNKRMVHEKVFRREGSNVLRLSAPIHHATVNNLSDCLVKANQYSELRMQSSERTYHPAVIMIASTLAFVRSYIFKLGFLEGWRGLVIAVANATGVFFQYMKIYAKHQL